MIKLTVTLMLLATAITATAAERLQMTKLDNGLKVIVKPDHRAPIVTSQVWYRIGSSYEYGGLTGISHALEHMMFKGTEKYGPGKFSEIIAANGGDENAFTGRDYTAYFQSLARDRLSVAFTLEADRMRHLTLPAAEFVKEMAVIKEERRMRTEDSPTALTSERFHAVAYLASPYRHPVIGWMGDLDTLTAEDLRAWYRQWYAPNNAILVVAGDVEPEAVFALAKEHFGPLKSESIPTPKAQIEPPQDGPRRIVVKAPAQEPYLLMGYPATQVGNTNRPDWEPYALEMLAEILDGGASARFSRELVRGAAIAADVDASYSAFTRLPGLFTVDGSPAKGHTVAELEQALHAQIERVRNEPVSADELERVRQRVIASKVFEQDSVYYQAMQIGLLESIGLDGQLADEYVARLKTVTAAQVQAVARTYLTDDHLTVAVLDPQPLQGQTLRAAATGATDAIR